MSKSRLIRFAVPFTLALAVIAQFPTNQVAVAQNGGCYGSTTGNADKGDDSTADGLKGAVAGVGGVGAAYVLLSHAPTVPVGSTAQVKETKSNKVAAKATTLDTTATNSGR